MKLIDVKYCQTISQILTVTEREKEMMLDITGHDHGHTCHVEHIAL